MLQVLTGIHTHRQEILDNNKIIQQFTGQWIFKIILRTLNYRDHGTDTQHGSFNPIAQQCSLQER